MSRSPEHSFVVADLDRDRAQLLGVLSAMMGAKEQVAATRKDRPDRGPRTAAVAAVRG